MRVLARRRQGPTASVPSTHHGPWPPVLSLEHLAGRTYATKISICSQGIFLPACVYCCMCEHLILLMEIPLAEVLSLVRYWRIGVLALEGG